MIRLLSVFLGVASVAVFIALWPMGEAKDESASTGGARERGFVSAITPVQPEPPQESLPAKEPDIVPLVVNQGPDLSPVNVPVSSELVDHETPGPAEVAGPVNQVAKAGEPEVDDEVLWHPIWKPFRSMVSAVGFARRLSELTALSISVLEDVPGDYEVAVSYRAVDDLDVQLETITALSGLPVARRIEE